LLHSRPGSDEIPCLRRVSFGTVVWVRPREIYRAVRRLSGLIVRPDLRRGTSMFLAVVVKGYEALWKLNITEVAR